MAKIASKYKIYGRKKGRNKNRYNLSQTFIKSILVKNIILNEKNHNILDIGSGSGENSLILSKQFPESKIIACENFLDGNLNLCNQVFLNNIKNILIYNGNVLEFFDTSVKHNIFDIIWILFPDPWPKKKHFKRRLINKLFMQKLLNKIKKNGEIHIVTDSQSYLRQILLKVYEFRNYFSWDNQNKIMWEFNPNELSQTKFYKKAIKYDRKPIYIKLRRL